jgi:hypothetical protein
VDPLGWTEVVAGANAVQGAQLVGPDAGGVDDGLGSDLDVGSLTTGATGD